MTKGHRKKRQKTRTDDVFFCAAGYFHRTQFDSTPLLNRLLMGTQDWKGGGWSSIYARHQSPGHERTCKPMWLSFSGSPCRTRSPRWRCLPCRNRSGPTARPNTFAACGRSSAGTRPTSQTNRLSGLGRIYSAPGKLRLLRGGYHHGVALDGSCRQTKPTSCFCCPEKEQSSILHQPAARSVGSLANADKSASPGSPAPTDESWKHQLRPSRPYSRSAWTQSAHHPAPR